uniref:Uncharacterized protein n=1 Tax=Ixodes ricinus TaxID=34613 RepID=A0A6B0UBL4_IXORI
MWASRECVVFTYAAMAASSSGRRGGLSSESARTQRRLASSVAIPGAAIEHRRRMSESTVAHCTCFTRRGTRLASSERPSEWASAHAQWMSLMAGCASWL